nr:hypothetical protein [Tanacetum cinerariifolium]
MFNRCNNRKLLGVSEDASSPAEEAMPALDTHPLDADAGADEIDSDGNVDPYYEARVSNTVGDVLERDLLPFVPEPYYIPYPYDESSGSESPLYTRDDWEEIHGVNLGLRKKELYKDPKVCRTALDRFPTPAETHRLRELSSVELSDRMSVLQCQLVTHGSVLNVRYDHSLRNVEPLTKRHPDSCITDKVPTNFNQSHVDQLKAHIVKLRDIPEGVLVRSGLSRVWCNPMCDPVLRLMSIHDFLCMLSLDKATEIAVTRPDPKVVTKADHSAKRKTSTGPEISTNAAKKTRSSQKVSGAGSSGLAAGDRVEQTDDGTLDDDGQRDGLEFAMEAIGNLNDVSQDTEVGAHAELSGGVRRATRASFHASHARMRLLLEAMPALDTHPLDADAGADEIASDGNVDPYYEARVSNTTGDVLERDLLPFVPEPYYIPYPYDESSRKLYKDPKVCRTALDRFHTPAETRRLRELSSVKLFDRMSMLQCQLVTHGSVLNVRYDHSLRNVERLTKRCAQYTQTIKKQSADLKQQNESTVRTNEEVSRLTAELGVLKSRCQTTKHKLSSWDKKHRKYRNERGTIAMEKATIGEELVGSKS